jgi:hypothetical protein
MQGAPATLHSYAPAQAAVLLSQVDIIYEVSTLTCRLPSFIIIIIGSLLTGRHLCTAHEQSHLNQKKFFCVCGKPFSRENDMRRHARNTCFVLAECDEGTSTSTLSSSYDAGAPGFSDWYQS